MRSWGWDAPWWDWCSYKKSLLSLSVMWGYDEKAVSQEEISHKNPIMLVHWSWLPASRTRRKFLLSKPLSLRCSIMAVPSWLIHPMRWQLPLPGPSSKGIVHHSWLQRVWRVRDPGNYVKASESVVLGVKGPTHKTRADGKVLILSNSCAGVFQLQQ